MGIFIWRRGASHGPPPINMGGGVRGCVGIYGRNLKNRRRYEMAKRLLVVIVVAAFALTSAGGALAAQWANPDLLLSAKQLKSKIDNPGWVVLDCRDLKHYAKGHIPGAISLGKRCKKALRDPSARVFKDVAKYDKLFSKVGIGNDTHVVIYGEHEKTDTMKDTAVAFWVLEYLGHDKAHVLNGGIADWINQGYPVSNEPTIKSAKSFKAHVVPSRYASTDEIVAIATGKEKGVQLIDARSEKEFVGKDIRALRGGHVPNVTLNVSHKDTFDQVKDRETGKMKDNGFLSPDRVASFYKDLDKNKRTISYCQTGTRSTLTYLELRLLGFKEPANWDDSWRVYGSSPAMYPIDDEQWYNFAAVNKAEKKVKKLEKKIEELEGKAKE
jgi:thiosulfate/3-mercaptopyruvate sulfurtransferase